MALHLVTNTAENIYNSVKEPCMSLYWITWSLLGLAKVVTTWLALFSLN